MYTDEVESKSLTLGLLQAADKYDVKALFRNCELHLCNNMAINNCAENFLGGYLHSQAQSLKKCSVDFIVQNFDEVKKTQGFSGILQHPGAALEIMEHLARLNRAYSVQ